jgi:aminoglycoside phosphotransferase (APT) family kinase protein
VTTAETGGFTDLGDVRSRLEHWARAQWGDGAQVPHPWPMPGNAGLSFGFDVLRPNQVQLQLVIRLSPPGVRRRGNTDVLRQVPLLTTLMEAGIPVARVVWSSGDPLWFGTDAVVQERLSAWPLHMWDAGLSHPAATGGSEPFLDQAVDALAAIHQTPWAEPLGDWEPMRSLGTEVAFWDTLLSRCEEPAWIEAGGRLRDVLLERQPDDVAVGIFHGDYQTNNILYAESGRLAAIVDWEISGLGAQLLDLGWLAMFTDPSCWDPTYQVGMRVTADPESLRRRYEESRQQQVDAFDYFRALACYRFGVIAAFNVRLHRTGRRVDASYERIAPSVQTLFAFGRVLASG